MESKVANLRNIINQSKKTKYDDHPLFSGKSASANSKYKTSWLKDLKEKVEEKSYVGELPHRIWEMLDELDVEEPVEQQEASNEVFDFLFELKLEKYEPNLRDKGITSLD